MNATVSASLARTIHDFRSPLATMVELAAAARSSDSTREKDELLTLIIDSGSMLLSLVEDFLYLSRSEADCGSTGYQGSREVDLRRMLDTLLRPVSCTAANKGLNLTWDVDDSVPASLAMDETVFTRVLLNLVYNAIKYTDTGGIEVSATYRETSGGLVTVEVSDTGRGIPDYVTDRIFDDFVQVRPCDALKGSGLGLAVCRELVRRAGGDIEVESEPGVGSVFRFTLPAPEGQAASKRREDTPGPSSVSAPSVGLKILVADDNPVNRTLAARLLESRGHDVTIVEDGRAALNELETNSFDAALLDVCMPGLSGMEIARRMLDHRGTIERPARLIALTGFSLASPIHDELIEAGFDLHLSRPLDACTLIEAVEGTMDGQSSNGRKRRDIGTAGGGGAAGNLEADKGGGAADSGETTGGVDTAEGDVAGDSGKANHQAPAIECTATDSGCAAFDREAALSHSGGDEQLLDILVDAFTSDCQAKLSVLEEALRRGDRRRLFETLHSLAGGAVNVGARRLGRLARKLSGEVKAGQGESLCSDTMLSLIRLELAAFRDAASRDSRLSDGGTDLPGPPVNSPGKERK